MTPQEALRKVWSLFPTGVTLINTLDDRGQVHSMTANGVTSVSLDPPLVLVCVGHSRNTHAFISKQTRFCVNFLTWEQREIAAYFARDPKERKGEAGLQFRFTRQGAPVLEGCLAYLDCSVEAAYETGDHTIFVGRVDDLEPGDGEPLVFYRSRFTRVTEP